MRLRQSRGLRGAAAAALPWLGPAVPCWAIHGAPGPRARSVGWATLASTLDIGTDRQSFGYGGTGKKSHARSFEDYGGPFGAQRSAAQRSAAQRSVLHRSPALLPSPRQPLKASAPHCSAGQRHAPAAVARACRCGAPLPPPPPNPGGCASRSYPHLPAPHPPPRAHAGLGDTIGCLLDMEQGEISFTKNGQALGVAFKVPTVRLPLCRRPAGIDPACWECASWECASWGCASWECASWGCASWECASWEPACFPPGPQLMRASWPRPAPHH
jgi:hypothetical protein